MLREDLQLQLQQLSEEHDALSADLAALPSTLLSTAASVPQASPAGAAAALGSHPRDEAATTADADAAGTVMASAGEAVGAAFGYSTARDASELEALLARYPLADEGVRRSVRDVHQALQERFLEKLATWRAEWEASGLAATKGEAPWACNRGSGRDPPLAWYREGQQGATCLLPTVPLQAKAKLPPN